LIEPVPKITIRKQIPSKKGYEVRQRPSEAGRELQIFDQEQGNRGCPDLNEKGVLGGAHKGLHFQILFEGLKEEINLSSILTEVTTVLSCRPSQPVGK
jgi:hypothetical protein